MRKVVLNKIINSYIEESKKALDTFLELDKSNILNASKLIVKAFKSGNKVLMCGNGGSASDAQHFAAELIGRFKSNRPSFAAISLNTDTSALTAIANDYDFTDVFSRQVEGIGKKGDILLAISTSGNSKNIIKAAIQAKKQKLNIISLTGFNTSVLEKNSDLCIKVPSKVTSHIQELHIIVVHLLCTLIEKQFFEKR
ncbi:D-sedoheptulose 7-phosphate isomerase [Alphaproteobacteria bacterium]|nr:D-sedoheptulose 7-phosphate isomerase [Alphaproteobacteria bacterium]